MVIKCSGKIASFKFGQEVASFVYLVYDFHNTYNFGSHGHCLAEFKKWCCNGERTIS